MYVCVHVHVKHVCISGADSDPHPTPALTDNTSNVFFKFIWCDCLHTMVGPMVRSFTSRKSYGHTVILGLATLNTSYPSYPKLKLLIWGFVPAKCAGFGTVTTTSPGLCSSGMPACPSENSVLCSERSSCEMSKGSGSWARMAWDLRATWNLPLHWRFDSH